VARVLQRGGHALDELVRRRVLQSFGLVVHVFPGVAESLAEIQLEAPMPTHDAERLAGSPGAQAHTPIRDVLDVSRLREPFDHAAHRCGLDLEGSRNLARGRWRASL